MKNAFLRFGAFLALVFYAGNVLFAADWAQSLMAGQRTLDFYLERAKVQTSQERFEELLEQGLDASVCEWERSAADLKLAGLEDWLFQKESFKESLNERALGVFNDWLMERKKSEGREIQKSGLYAELKKLAQEFFYVGPNGNQTRIVPLENILEAKSQYEKKALEIVQKYTGEGSSESAEFGACLVERLALNELTNELLYDHGSLKKMSDSQAALFIADKLASQVENESEQAMERLFNSLQEQADYVDAKDLLAKKETKVNWLARFEKELELGLKKWSDAEDEFLSARSEWEREAESVYLNDSKKWQEAYDELQERKIAWSQKIEERIQEGRKEWQSKLDVLGDEIEQSLREFQDVLFWENEQKKQLVQDQEETYAQIRAILESAQGGVELWYERWGEKYNGLYSYWKTEDNCFGKDFDLSLVDSSYLKNEIYSWKQTFAESLNDCYLKITKKQYEEELARKKAEEEAKQAESSQGQNQSQACPLDPRYIASLGKPKTEEEIFLEEYPQLACSKESNFQEIESARQKILQNKKYAQEISEDYWEFLKDASSLWNAHEELFEWLDLFDLFKTRIDEALAALHSDSLANIEIYDELSNEKAKAAWLVDYWSDRVKTAQALADYAQNDFSDLEKAQETEKNLEAALENYNQAKDEYQRAFDSAKEKRLEFLAEQEKYYALLEASQKLHERINSERKKYDDLYQAKVDVLNQVAKDPSVDLLYDLESLNYNAADFKKYLWTYCSEEQAASEKALLSQKEKIRDIVVNGCGEDESALGEAAQGQNSASLSIASLELLQDALSELCASPSLNLQKAKGLVPDLRKLGQGEARTLEDSLAAFEEGNGSLALAKDELRRFLSIAQKEIQNRQAILLLLDGSAQEIHQFFDGDEDFCSLYQNYKAYSGAVLQEEADAALNALQEKIACGQKDNLEEYFAQLDQAAQGASAFVLCATDFYKKLLLCQRDCAGLEESLAPKVLECSASLGMMNFSGVDWHCGDCEDFLLGESYYGAASGYDRKAFERLSYGRKELLFELQSRMDFLLGSARKVNELDSALSGQAAAVQNVQKEYEKCLDGINAGNRDAQINQYVAACQRYNDYLEEANKSYEKLEKARRGCRLAQEICFYAQNEYLHESYNPSQALLSCQESLQKARQALDVLNAMEQDRNCAFLEEYKRECLNYYKGRVMLFEYEKRVAAQSKSLYKAQSALRAVEDKLVCDAVPQGTQNGEGMSSFAKEILVASVDQNGEYSFSLNEALAPLGAQNQALLENYFFNQSVVQTDVYQNERRVTKAKVDALDFLQGLDGKPYSLTDLAFCVLHLKGLGSQSQKIDWFKSGENPELNENYKIGDLPDSVHGLDVSDLYRSERLKTAREAYERVVALGGEGDIVKFILHCDQNFSHNLNLDQAFRNAFILASIEKPLKKVKSEGDSWQSEGNDMIASAALLFLITCLPFGLGSWAWAPATALAAAGTACLLVAEQFFDYAEDMSKCRDGCKTNLDEWSKSWQKLLAEWKKARDKVKEEEEKLSLLIAGKESLDNKKLSWSDFKRSLEEAFDSGALEVNSTYFMSIYDSASGQGDLKGIFEELSSKEDFYDVASAMQRIGQALEANYVGKKNVLESYVASREGGFDFDKGWYYKDLLSFYAKELLPSVPIAKNRESEDYLTDALALYNSLLDEALAYSDRNRLERKSSIYSLIYADFDEQRSLWEDKNEIILDTAQADWAQAQENINLSFNAWQREFASEWQAAGEAWEKNYRDFLDKKEDWIARQYLSGSADADMSYSTVERLKKSFVDSLCDMEKFSRLERLVQNLADFSQNENFLPDFFEKADASLIKDCNSALFAKNELQKTVQEAAARAAVQKCLARLESRVKGVFDSIKSQNKGIEDWEMNLVREAGYTVDSTIHRDAVSDVSFFATQRQRQTVHRYEWFAAAAPCYDLDVSGYCGSSEWYIMKKAEEAEEKIQKWSDEIFGSSLSPKNGGRLARHIGQAPVFVQNPNPSESRESNVKDFGSGQIGKILLDFQWNSIVSAAACADFEKALYDQKLASVGDFSLPSLREVVGVVLDIVSKIPAFYALQYADDVVFGMIDVAQGYKTWGEVAAGFARQGVLAGVSKGVSALGAAAGKLLKNSSAFFKGGAGSQVLKGIQNAAGGYLNNVASNYVNAFDFASGKMDWEKAASSWLDASAAASAAGSFLGQSLGAINNIDANGLALNSKVFGNIQTMNAAIGSLAGQGLNYLATGDFTVNLLNINGVGLLEVGISDGGFKAAFGKGGADLSLQTLAAFAQGTKDAAKVASLKSSGQEGQALLNASNLLAWSGGKDNVQLASDLFSQKRRLLFEDAADSSKFGKNLDGAIILDQALLERGMEGQALIASCASLQNLNGMDKAAAIDAMDFSKLKKSDGSSYTQEEIKKAKDKLKSDSDLDSMAQISSVLSFASQALDFDLSAVSDNSLGVMANAYKQNGMAGVYALYAQALDNDTAKEGQVKTGFAQLLEQPWFQNVQENRGILLGQSLSMEEYNKAAKENAVERYVAKELKEYCSKKKNAAAAGDLERIEREARAKAESEIVEGVANEEYGYKPESYSLDIKNYGCTLATAAYIAYSITGSVTTLSQANDILNKEDLYLYGTDKNGVTQKNLIGSGDSYAAAVNAIAGGEYLKKDGENFSVNADIRNAKGKIIADNRQSVFDRLLKNSKDQNEVYFSHMRVNDSHSVLFDSLSYTDEKNYKTSTLSVMDPWQGGAYAPKSWSDISRADFYKLTQTGKELYELTRINLRQES